MKTGKAMGAMGPDGILIEAWKCIGEVGRVWLTRLFNEILRTKKMPDEWRSVVVPIYKKKKIYKVTRLHQLSWD